MFGAGGGTSSYKEVEETDVILLWGSNARETHPIFFHHVLEAVRRGAKLFVIGYEHSLSKRTILKAVYAHLNNDNNANYDFGINSVGIATSPSSAIAPASGLGASLNGIQLGLRHSF